MNGFFAAIAKRFRAPLTDRHVTPTIFQTEITECGAVCLGIILADHGRWEPIEMLRIRCGVSRDATDLDAIKAAAISYGLKASGFILPSDRVRAGIKKNPLIIHWDHTHFVVLEGVSPTGAYINDPATGPRFVSNDEFENCYSGAFLQLLKTPEFTTTEKPAGVWINLINRLRLVIPRENAVTTAPSPPQEPPKRVGKLLRKMVSDLVKRRAKPSRSGWAVLFAVLCAVLLAFTVIFPPAFTRFYVDIILGHNNLDWISKFCVCMAITGLLLVWLTWLQKRCLLWLETSLSLTSSAQILQHMLRLPLLFFGQRQSGEIAKRLTLNDKVAGVLSQKLGATYLDVFTLTVVALILFTYDWKLTLGCLGIAFVNVIAVMWYDRRRTDASRRYVQEHGNLWGIANYGLRSIEDIKAKGGETELFGRWAGSQAKTVAAKQELDRISQTLTILPPLTAFCTTALILWQGGQRVIEGRGFSVGLLMAYQALAVIMAKPIAAFVGFGGVLQEAKADLARLDDLLRYPEDESCQSVEAPAAAHFFPPGDKLQGTLEFKNVNFGYSRTIRLLHDFNLTISAGSRVALVGGSGSGKSTVAKLAAGLLHPDPPDDPDAPAGELRYDGHLRGDLPREVLSNSIAMVDQDILLFEGSVLENLTLWDSTALDRNTVGASKDAEIAELISSRQGGFAGTVDEAGANFSGGQRQRIELARALAIQPSILILDEATSALDPLVEDRILQNLKRRGCTCLVVAHRLSTIRDCDLILVMEKGEVVQSGTHESMYEKAGPYRNLFLAEEAQKMDLPPLEKKSTAEAPAEDPNASWPQVLSRGGISGEVIPYAGVPWPGQDKVWLIMEGQLDLFATDLSTHLRTFVATFPAGEALFGMDVGDPDAAARFDFVAQPDTKVIFLTVRTLEQCARTHPDIVGGLLDAWVKRFSRAVESPNPLPTADLLFTTATSAEVQLKNDQVASTAHELVWVCVDDGRIHLLEWGSFPSAPPAFFIPLCREAWIKAHGNVTVRIFPTKDLPPLSVLSPSLQTFVAVNLECILRSREAFQEGERKRRGERTGLAQHAAQAAIDELVAVVENPQKDGSEWRRDPHADLPLIACSLVGSAAGIKVVGPRRNPGESNFVRARVKNPIDVIAKASRFRYRKVALPEEWWRHECGPLVGQLKTGEPVALLPRWSLWNKSKSRYVLKDPRGGQPAAGGMFADFPGVGMDETQAGQVIPYALTLYRPLPADRMDARKLLRFGGFGLAGDFFMIIGAGVLVGIVSLVPPFLIGYLFDSVIPQADYAQLDQIVLGLGAAAVAIAVFEFTRAIAVLRVEMRMDQGIQAAVWDRLLSLPLAFFRRYSAGDLADRALGIDQMRENLSKAGISSILSSVSSIFLVAMLFVYSWQLAFFGMALVAFAFVVTVFANSRGLPYQEKLMHNRGKINGFVVQLISGVSKLRVAGAEDRAFNVWAGKFAEQKRTAMKAGVTSIWVSVLSAAWPVFSSLILFLVFVQLQKAAMKDGKPPISTGDFLAFFSAFSALLLAILSLATASAELLVLVPLFRRLKPIIEELPEVDEARKSPGELSGDLEVSRVTFRYPDGLPVLHGVSFHAKAGEFIALVGDSGSGKSTLIRLLLGLQVPESGSIFYDGQDLAAIDAREVREQCGVVMQVGSLMATTIFQNIIIDPSYTEYNGSEEEAKEAAWHAATAAGLDQDIRAMPQGMDTFVNEGGTTFSGGQKQRLMIARALAKKPRIIFFDEATSALDNRTQKIVMESLKSLQATRVVVAHRLSTIVEAKRIYFLQNGEVVQSGSHDDLVRVEGPYREFVKRQI